MVNQMARPPQHELRFGGISVADNMPVRGSCGILTIKPTRISYGISVQHRWTLVVSQLSRLWSGVFPGDPLQDPRWVSIVYVVPHEQ